MNLAATPSYGPDYIYHLLQGFARECVDRSLHSSLPMRVAFSCLALALAGRSVATTSDEDNASPVKKVQLDFVEFTRDVEVFGFRGMIVTHAVMTHCRSLLDEVMLFLIRVS